MTDYTHAIAQSPTPSQRRLYALVAELRAQPNAKEIAGVLRAIATEIGQADTFRSEAAEDVAGWFDPIPGDPRRR